MMNRDGYKVLVVDMDSQGNTTELLTDTACNDYIGKSVLEAMYERDASEFIVKVTSKLHVLPANNLLATFPRWVWTGQTWNMKVKTEKPNQPLHVLRETLEKVKDDYDYILIDTPPSISEHMTNALFASDWVVVMFECSRWCYDAIPNFMETVDGAIAAGNKNLKKAGIVRTLNDARRTDMQAFAEQIEEDYPDLVFETIINRRAPIGRISLYGFEDNTELKQALGPHLEYYEELINRVGKPERIEQKEVVKG